MIFLKNVVAFAKPEINYKMIIRTITPPRFPCLPCRYAVATQTGSYYRPRQEPFMKTAGATKNRQYSTTYTLSLSYNTED